MAIRNSCGIIIIRGFSSWWYVLITAGHIFPCCCIFVSSSPDRAPDVRPPPVPCKHRSRLSDMNASPHVRSSGLRPSPSLLGIDVSDDLVPLVDQRNQFLEEQLLPLLLGGWFLPIWENRRGQKKRPFIELFRIITKLVFTSHFHRPSMAIMTRSSLLRSSNLLSRFCSSCLQRHLSDQSNRLRCVDSWMHQRGLTVTPGCPDGGLGHSSCSPEWTTPGSASPLHHGHFLEEDIRETMPTSSESWDQSNFVSELSRVNIDLIGSQILTNRAAHHPGYYRSAICVVRWIEATRC